MCRTLHLWGKGQESATRNGRPAGRPHYVHLQDQAARRAPVLLPTGHRTSRPPSCSTSGPGRCARADGRLCTRCRLVVHAGVADAGYLAAHRDVRQSVEGQRRACYPPSHPRREARSDRTSRPGTGSGSSWRPAWPGPIARQVAQRPRPWPRRRPHFGLGKRSLALVQPACADARQPRRGNRFRPCAGLGQPQLLSAERTCASATATSAGRTLASSAFSRACACESLALAV